MENNGKQRILICTQKMDKEINNINNFGKLLPKKKFQKILLHISPAKVQDYLMIKSVFASLETA